MMISTPTSARRYLTAVATLTALCGLVSHVQAVPVAANAGAALSGTTVAAHPELAGVVLEDKIRNFSITSPTGAVLRGTFQDRVVKHTSTGQLEFTYRIKNSADSSGNIVVVRRSGYQTFPTVDIDFRLDGLGTVGAPAVSRPGAPGPVAQFDFFNNPIKPGQESRFHFISTTATSYDESGLATIQASFGVRTGFKVFEPKVASTQPTPQPKLPNLRTSIVGPKRAKRGEDISKLIKVYAFNTGVVAAPGTTGAINPANGYMIDVILSSDTTAPAGYAVYSPNYSEDVLLLGGRISNTQDLAPGATTSYATGATIPVNTPPGNYYLAVRIDSGNKVTESNEADNTYFLPISIY